MNQTLWRSVFCVAMLAAAVGNSARAADDNGLRFRAITSAGRQFSGVSVPGDLNTHVSEGFAGKALTADAAAKDEVIGYDQRVQVSDTTDFPHRAIGFLSTACTGTLIGPRHVLTAAHCVYSTKTNTWYGGITFSPGRNAGTLPYGAFDYETVYAPQGYTDNHDTRYDYALIVLRQPIGNSTGWFSFEWNDRLDGNEVHIVGYPSDKGTGTQQFESACPIDEARAMDITYRCSTSGGMSGSAVWTQGSQAPTIYGVHVYGLYDANGRPAANSATRITSTVFQQLKYWISRHP